jgi:hypothetical protein
VYFKSFDAAGFATYKGDCGFRDIVVFGKKLDQGVVGFALFRRGRYLYAQISFSRIVRFPAFDFVFLGGGGEFDGDFHVFKKSFAIKSHVLLYYHNLQGALIENRAK